MNLNTLNEALRVIREADSDCTIQKMQVLLFIASCEPEGTDHQTLINRLGLSKSQASKVVADWTALTSYKMAGPGFVSSDVDPMYARSRIVKLTPKGREFIRKIKDIP